jgi:predicted metal-binding protein
VPDGVEVPKDHRPQLHVCVSCRRQGAAATDGAAPTEGRLLFERLRLLLDTMGAAAPVDLLPALCFANCERGLTAGISAAGKWSYLLGELGSEHAADLLTYARAYAAAKTGVVLPSGRPASLQKNVIARFPAQSWPVKDAAE